ncbi:CMD domain-containing protein, partial [Enterobacter hormaechei subsp. xiangfangensis]
TPVLCHEPMLLNLTGEILLNHPLSEGPASSMISAARALLVASPDRFSAAQLTPLTGSGLSPEKAINLLTRDAFYGWLNRLRVALGKEE